MKPARSCTVARGLPYIVAAALLITVFSACQQPEPSYQERLLTEIAIRHGRSVSESLRQMPFLTTPRQGADLPLLHGVLHDGRIPKADINDAETWRAAAAADFPGWKSTLRQDLWQLEVRPLGSQQTRVGVLYQKSLPTQIPWAAIGRALDYGSSLSGSPVPESAGNAVLIVYGADVPNGSQAVSYGSHIAIRTAYRDHPQVSAWILAHEIAHLWWRSNAPYVDEGMGELIAHLANEGAKRPVIAATPCDERTIYAEAQRPSNLCDYALGGDMFYRLMRLNPNSFAEKTRKLYLTTPQADATQLSQVFRDEASRALIQRYLPRR